MMKTPVAIYTDAGLLSHNPSEFGGTWAFVAVDEDDRKVFYKSGVTLTCNLKVHRVSNVVMEQIAIVRAMEAMPEGWSGMILSDCQPALIRVESDYDQTHGVSRFPAAENNLPKSVSRRSKRAAARLGKVRFVLVQGHPNKKDLIAGVGSKSNLPVSKWNVWADQRCTEEKIKFREQAGILI